MLRRTVTIASFLVLASSVCARAQRVPLAPDPVTVSHESLGLSLGGSSVLTAPEADTVNHLLWLDDPSTTRWRSLADLVDRLPLRQLEGFVGEHPRLRWCAAVVGGGLVAAEQIRGAGPAYLGTVGVQALRISLAGAFAPGGFHLEPSVGDGGFAVSFRKVT